MPGTENENLTAAARHLDQAIRDLQRVPAASAVLLHALKARQALIEMTIAQVRPPEDFRGGGEPAMTANLHTPLARFDGPPAEAEAEQIELLLRAVEADVHAGGWGQLPIYGSVWRFAPDRLQWTTQPVPPLMQALPPEMVLDLTASAAETPAVARLMADAGRRLQAGTHYVAHALVVEKMGLIYHLDDDDPARQAAYKRAAKEGRIASHPDARRCRVVLAALGNGKVVCLGRTHGEETPEYNDGRQPTDGQMATALTRLARAFTRAEAAGLS